MCGVIACHMHILCLQLKGAEGSAPPRIMAVAGPLADVESLVCLKDLFNRFGSEDLFTETRYPMDGSATDLRSSYIMNTTIAGIEVRGVVSGCDLVRARFGLVL